ncbi:MAG: helix-turn-helix transcriptional regulator, partial [Anaerolineales bacterium]|nr:helix-turn-helix transcriptional regulator [Anaerolineales bacterium]
RQRDVRADYVDQLLAAAGTTPGSAVNVALPDPLTAREEQILGLLAAGLTNQEIAAQLVISPETVKRHARHI